LKAREEASGMSDFVIGMGANLGVRESTLASAASDIAVLAGVALRAVSAVYESDAVGMLDQPRFLNAAVRIETALDADALFDRLLAVEAAHGRVRVQRWGPRTLDLDVLWASERVSSERLHVPHARVHERAFALGPLLDVAPELGAQYAAQLAALGGRPARYGQLVYEPHAQVPVQFVPERASGTGAV
jgi:2-amino-4-hydroxy-6-hydroxymethyldihydropteridine diphosphokinase